MKANGPERPSFHLLSLNLISKRNDMLRRVAGRYGLIPPASPLGGSGVARMTNFKLKDPWEFLLQSPLSRRDNGKVGSFGAFPFFSLSLLKPPAVHLGII